MKLAGRRPPQRKPQARAARPHDAREAQAETLARRFKHGERGLGGAILPAAATRFEAAASAAQALPGVLRGELELAFDADLAPLRVHVDAAAASAARGQRAAAFAAGTHLYFAAGRYAPASLEGRSLIAHEVVHALQQAGRRGAAGRWQLAAGAAGDGPVQCHDEIGSENAGDPALFEALRTLHRARTRAADFDATVTAVRNYTGGALVNDTSRPRYAFPLVTHRGEFLGVSAGAKGFVLDCFKLLGYFHSARDLIDSDTRLEVQVHVMKSAFFDFLREDPEVLSWSCEALRHPSLQALWPGAIVAGYRDALLTPHSPPPAANPRIAAACDEQVRLRNEQATTRSRLPQERVFLAWQALLVADAARVDDCTRIRADLATQWSALAPTERVIDGVAVLRQREQQLLDDAATPPHRRLLAERLIGMIDADIAPLWAEVTTADAAWRTAFDAFGDPELVDETVTATTSSSGDAAIQLPAFPARGANEPAVRALHAVLQAQLPRLFAGGSGDRAVRDEVTGADTGSALPAPEAYAVALEDFRAALEMPTTGTRGETVAPLLERLDQLLLRRARAPRRDAELVRALGLLLLLVDRLNRQAGGFDAGAAAATPFRDVQGAHRTRLARALLQISRWMGWTDLLTLIAPAFPIYAENAVPQLWLESDWQVDEETGLSRLQEDFPENRNVPFAEGLPFTIDHVVKWFRFDRNRRLRAVLLTELAHESTASARTRLDYAALAALDRPPAALRGQMPGAEAELAERERGVAPWRFDLLMPQRFSVERWEAVVPAGDEDAWGLMIYAHPKTDVSILRHKSTAAYVYVLVPHRVRHSVFLWVLPSLQGLVDLTAALPRLQAFGSPGATLDEFLDRLASGRGDPTAWSRIEAEITGRLTALNAPIERELPLLWTRFTTLRRRILVLRLRERFDGYVDDRHMSGGPIGESPAATARRLQTPVDALNQVLDFERTALPPAEAAAQTALLVLMLAPELARLFEPPHTEGRVAPGFYRLMGDALAFSDGDDARLAELRRITNEYDTEGGNIAYVARILAQRRSLLTTARTAIENALAEAQQGIGFEGVMRSNEWAIEVPSLRSGPIFTTSDTNPDHQREWHLHQRVVAGHPDEETGDVVRLLAVHRRFTYRPAVGAARGGPYIAPEYTDGDGNVYGGRTGVALPDHELFTLRIGAGTEPVVVRANADPALMQRYTDIFLWRAFQISMEELVAISQAVVEWGIMAASVAAPEVGYADIAARVMQFIASGDFPECVRLLKDDPGELVTRLLERLRNDLLQPENVWRFLLLAGQHNPLAPLLAMMGRRPTRTLPPATTRLGRVVRTLRRLGERIHNALARVRERVQGPVRAVEGNLARRPTLSWVLRRAVHIFEILPDLIPVEWVEGMARGEIPATPDAIARAVTGGLDEMETDMRDNTIRLLEGIQHYELPAELVDLALATELIVQLVCDSFGPRARIVRTALDLVPVPQEQRGRFAGFTSLYALLCAQIARLWEGTPFDPNVYWQQEALPVVGGRFVVLRDELVASLYATIDTFLVQALHTRPLARPAAADLPDVAPVAQPLEAEAAPARAAGAQLDPHAWRLPAEAGRPLATPVRRRFEARFGEDFSHVRLHDGAASRAATAPIGAEAVTSGSHVYLDPAIPAGSRRAERLLAHELTHVVQQTGSHPPGSAPLPRPGRSGGLRVDRTREAEAERAAAGVERGTALYATPGAPAGAQPALAERTVESIIATLTTIRGSGDFTSTAPSTSPLQGESTAHALVDELWEKLRLMNTAGTDDFAAFTANPAGFSTPNVRERIKEHVRADRAGLNAALNGILRLAQRPRSPHVEGQPENELAPGRFIDLLAAFLYAERGISLQIRLDPAQEHILGVKVLNVALERISGNSQLWDVAVGAAFAGRSIPGPADSLQNAVRQYLRNSEPEAFIWDSNEFKFSHHFVEEFIAMRESLARGAQTEVPPKSEYLNTGSPRGDGLAVATHGSLTGGRSIGTFGRESHHTTQFLLAEFFGNHADASRRAFPPHHPAYPPAIRFDSSGKVTGIEAPGHPRIDVASLDPNSGRGDAMPAILIAATTHQRAGLHVLRESTWHESSETVDKDNTATQGIAIENTFTRALPEELRPRDDSPERRRRFADAIARDPAGANRAFYNAVRDTYHWMYQRMIPALEAGLVSHELPYYRSIAALSHTTGGGSENPALDPSFNLTETDVRTVFRTAKANNDRVMSGYGWPTPSL